MKSVRPRGITVPVVAGCMLPSTDLRPGCGGRALRYTESDLRTARAGVGIRPPAGAARTAGGATLLRWLGRPRRAPRFLLLIDGSRSMGADATLLL
ncbi:MAG: hypothetical protein ACK4OK_06265, partial [Thermoflexus sp.]